MTIALGQMTPEQALAHFGVKGMKWGVRKNEKRVQQIERVATGRGSRIDKAKVGLLEVSPKSMRKNGGLSGAAKNKAANIRARNDRNARGKATAADLIAKFGGDRLVDTGRADKGRESRNKIMVDGKTVAKQGLKTFGTIAVGTLAVQYATTGKVGR